MEACADSKPQDALAKIADIRKKAQNEHNEPQLLRSIMAATALNAEINEVTFAEQLKDLRQFQEQTSNPVALALARYLESDLFWKYYENDRWTIDERTLLNGFVPDNIDEWSANIFRDTVRRLRKLAMDEPAIRTAKTADFEPLVVLRDDSRSFRPTLFDLMAYHCIEGTGNCYSNEEKIKLYAEVAALHSTDAEPSAHVMALIDCEEFKRKEGLSSSEQYLANLGALLKQFNDQPASVLIRIRKAEELMGCLLRDEDERKRLGANPADILYLCQEGLVKYPSHPFAKVLKSKVEEIKLPAIDVDMDDYNVHSGQKVELKVRYANLANAVFKLERLDCTADKFMNCKDNGKLPKKPVGEYKFELVPSNYCIETDTTLFLPPLEYGVYCLSFNKQTLYFTVTDFYGLDTRCMQGGKTGIVVVDRNSGAPLQGVDVRTYNQSDKTTKQSNQAQTGDDGFASVVFDKEHDWTDHPLSFRKGADVYWKNSASNGSDLKQLNRNNERPDVHADVFTDRAIYRPGQTIHFKVICYQVGGDVNPRVKADKTLTVELTNDNGQVAEQTLTTNTFGSVAGSFVLPAGGLTGDYTLSVPHIGSKTIKVEEYKRPNFQTELAQPDGSFAFGDSITLKGSAAYLMAAPVQQAKVAFTITRRQNWWLRWLAGKALEEVVASGETTTTDDGAFAISFCPQKPQQDALRKVTYTYEVKASVTDANGETQEQVMNVAVGDVSLAIVTPACERSTFAGLAQLAFSVQNLNQQPQNATVAYTVLKDSAVVATGQLQATAENGFALNLDTSSWASGRYQFRFSTTDEKGRTVEASFETILYRTTDVRPPVFTELWTEEMNSTDLADGEQKTVRIGTSFANAHLLVLTYGADTVLGREWIDLNNEIKTLHFGLQPGQDVLNVQFMMVRDGHSYSSEINLRRKAEDRNVPLKLAVFRDKVQAGSREEWQIELPKGCEAEVLAGMYDASLDQFAPNQWQAFPAGLFMRSFRFPTITGFFFSHYGIGWQGVCKNQSWFCPSYDTWRDYDTYSYRRRRMMCCQSYKRKVYHEDAEFAMNSLPEPPVPASEPLLFAKETKKAKPALARKAGAGGAEDPKPHVRTNFAETAFFYPQLLADKNGMVNLKFTMPESLTKWKLMALAHTQNLHSGTLLQEVVSQKDFTIQPNYPRFLRQGDQCVFTAKLVNITGKACSGTARLQLLDPVTEKPVADATCMFGLEAGKNGAVEWKLDVPHEADALLVRVLAVAGNFSDAEQKMLPVMDCRTVVTHSQPVFVRGGTSKEFTLSTLANSKSKTLKSRFLKLEMATNPVWYAVQALPSVAAVEHENATSYSAAYFAAQMAQHIAGSNPRVFNVIERWKLQGTDKQTLLSNLEKNEEVKNVLLAETPWVLQAKSESESKQRLAMLFDLNTLQNNSTQWLKKLSNFQNPDGGFAWFRGMRSDVYTTLFVVDNFARLQAEGLAKDADQRLISNATHYLDRQLQERYLWLITHDKDYKKNARISTSEVYYLQVRACFPKLGSDAGKDVYDFYYGLMKKQWMGLGLQGKAMAAMALHMGGDKDLAKEVVESLRQFSTSGEEMGMYWKNNRSSWLWEDNAIATHTRIMEALRLVDNNQSEQDELRIWLLNQKRTQNWSNLIANVDALRVLLLGNKWLEESNTVQVNMGGKEVKPEQQEAGTGYFATYVNGADVKPEMAHISLASSKGGNLSWGALYWQFSEELDAVEANGTGLGVTKSVMLKAVEGSNKVLKAIDDKTTLKVGDQLVVRLVLRADRDLDYVSLKDQRAACLEPLSQLSGYRWSEGVGYYQCPKDAAMYYYFDHLPKGSYVFEYTLAVTHKGLFTNGITSAQCLYAPEFQSSTGSVRIKVE